MSPVPEQPPGTPRRPGVLVLRPDHLGDLLLTLPAIAALRRRLPDAHIASMVPAELLPIAQRAVDLDEALTMPVTMRDAPPQPEAPAIAHAAAELRDRFELALLPRPHDPWSGALAATAGLPLRVGHPQPGTLPFLTHAFPEDVRRHVAREAVVLALRAARLLGARPTKTPASGRRLLRLLPGDERAATELLVRLDIEGSPAIVQPTAGWPLKTWPLERWSDVARTIGESGRSAVLVVGQPRDRRLLDAIAEQAGSNVHAIHDISIGTLAALHARARLVVGMDSGALHLAALFGAPVVGLFGPFEPRRVAPLSADAPVRVLWHALPCSPCGTLEAPPCGATREPACLLSISPDEVGAEVLRLGEPTAAQRG